MREDDPRTPEEVRVGGRAGGWPGERRCKAPTVCANLTFHTLLHELSKISVKDGFILMRGDTRLLQLVNQAMFNSIAEQFSIRPKSESFHGLVLVEGDRTGPNG